MQTPPLLKKVIENELELGFSKRPNSRLFLNKVAAAIMNGYSIEQAAKMNGILAGSKNPLEDIL